jgi:hypothetical protein
MNWTSTKLSLALIASLAAASAAAQQTGAPASVPGSADAAKVSSANREANSDYNHLVGQGDGVAKKADDSAKKTIVTAVKAMAADIAPGAALRDIKGVPIATVVSVDGDQVIVDTGKTKVGVPLEGFGKDDKGLLLSITAEQFNAAIEKAHAAAQAQPAGAN